MKAIEKSRLIEQVVHHLENSLSALSQAAKSTYSGAIHEDAKSEDKYDTRSLEASYLAGAQAERVSNIQDAIELYKRLRPRNFEENKPVAISALVEVEIDDREASYFIGPDGGGIRLNIEEQEVLVITPKSPLGRQLIGKLADDEFEFSVGGRMYNGIILSVR